MRVCLWWALAITVLTACDIDFVAVDDVEESGLVRFQTHQGTGVEGSLTVSLPKTGEAPKVFLGELQLQGTAERGRWWYHAEPAIDTLQPRLELEIRTNVDAVAPLPFVTRDGAAIRRANGNIEFWLRHGGEASDPRLRWSLALRGPLGQELFMIRSEGPMSNPLVLNDALVPATAVAAEITVTTHSDYTDGAYPLYVTTESIVRVPIPASSSQASIDPFILSAQ